MNLINTDSLSWKVSSIHALFDSTSANEILKLRISTDPRHPVYLDPIYLWHFLHLLGLQPYYSIQSHFQFCFLLFWKSIWKLNLNDRLRLFLWKIAWNILPTKERLGHLFPISDTHCPLCKVADDSLTHLFFECFFARVVWRLSFWLLDSTAFHFSSMVDWIAAIITPDRSLGIPLKDQHKFQIFASVACDILWFYRNKALHENLSFDARSVSIHINKISLEHFQAWHSVSQVQLETWAPPPPNWIKIN
jgi:hypothetical protein